MTSASGTSLSALRDRIGGAVLMPGDDGYDHARAVWNAMVDRKPRVIVRCAGPDDVAVAVRYAQDAGLEVAVRCGGHSVVGHAVPEDGLMIDLTTMNQVHVDPARRRARVEGGALLGALDRASLPHGLATTAGNVSHTGVGGLTLGGGMGWLARQHGLSCDNVVSFTVVTADGRNVRASADQNPELYWGLRGGGGNFGVVTEFEFQLHPVTGRTFLADLTFSLDDAPGVMRGWRDLIATAPRAATMTAWAGAQQGEPCAGVGFVWVGDPDDAASLLADLRSLGRPMAEQAHELHYVDLQRIDDNIEGHTFRRYWKGHYLRELSDAAIDAFLMRGAPDGRGEALPNASLQAYGGAISDVADAATAFCHRDTLVEFVAAAKWEDPAEDEARIAAARRYGASLAPYASGAYVNALTDEGRAGVQRAYPPEHLARLTALKNTWDPDNVFHLNHNIEPAPRSTP
ncbi:FAD-binding oxidoreductase [Phytoactinopolyspora halotolerans]|uniref:FAD-binding oxidoreductase n=1 Tax=Phytoactinopolyspora halotolerans TaxID=1981512 RepID=A0A6L9S3Z0_9ACTN|nr:FAD-binding oxidoreductase [Phytoactinopolyspora halotolerans]NED99550.1 FAD-binding oxidoreductase [Phytoactinopolyspora halotolerans]